MVAISLREHVCACACASMCLATIARFFACEANVSNGSPHSHDVVTLTMHRAGLNDILTTVLPYLQSGEEANLLSWVVQRLAPVIAWRERNAHVRSTCRVMSDAHFESNWFRSVGSVLLMWWPMPAALATLVHF